MSMAISNGLFVLAFWVPPLVVIAGALFLLIPSVAPHHAPIALAHQ